MKRKVTIPEGGAKGMIGVEGTATMKMQSTKPGHREDGSMLEGGSIFRMLVSPTDLPAQVRSQAMK